MPHGGAEVGAAFKYGTWQRLPRQACMMLRDEDDAAWLDLQNEFGG